MEVISNRDHTRRCITAWKKVSSIKTRIHWLDRRIVRKQLDIMPTNHYVQNQGKLMMQSRENGQKPQFGQFLTIWRSNISKLKIFLKNRFHSNWRLYLVLTSGQKPKKSLDFFEKNIKVSDFGLIWRHFREYLQTALPTSQAIITNNTDFVGPGWRRSKKW